VRLRGDATVADVEEDADHDRHREQLGEATERPFTGKYWDHFQPGRYDCVGCGTRLFQSDSKFDAGCGWPSYAEPINSDVVERIRAREGRHGCDPQAARQGPTPRCSLTGVHAGSLSRGCEDWTTWRGLRGARTPSGAGLLDAASSG
jgi:hypothetical protein